MFLNLLMLNVIFLLLPFFLAYFHSRAQPEITVLWLYYRYFLFFNLVLSGLVVALRVAITTPHLLSYAAAVLSWVVVTACVMWTQKSSALVPALGWIIFLALASLVHLNDILTHTVSNSAILILHVGYDCVVIAVLWFFLVRLKRKKYE